MNSQSVTALTYTPAYIGLFLAQTLAAICNAFLDIQYGSFGFESLFWSLIFAFTLWIGWRQRGEVSAAGKRTQKIVLIIGLLLTAIVFVRLWGFPRAGLAILLMLQAAQNCVSVTRRQLYLGLLVSLVAVLFAASHYRADWTMLFYLVPYIAAVVFTLVAEQINRRAQDIRRQSLKITVASGQGVAIAFATALILISGALLYSVTPQLSWPNMFWNYGQPGNVGGMGELGGSGQGGQLGDHGPAGNGQSGQWQPGNGIEMPAGGQGLTIAAMREAAHRPGMPRWQSELIESLAGTAESLDKVLQPIRLGLDELWDALKEWLKQHLQAVVWGFIALFVLALLLAACTLGKELRPVIWLRVQFDYVWLVYCRRNAAGNVGVLQYYQAMQRLFDLHELKRPVTVNSREFLAQVQQRFAHLSAEVQMCTQIFEKARYGNQPVTDAELARMRTIYQRLFQRVDVLNTLDTRSGRAEMSSDAG